jgi:hypothetical protein
MSLPVFVSLQDVPLKISIIEHLSEPPDPRILLKTRHNLVDIVTMALLAFIGGADD